MSVNNFDELLKDIRLAAEGADKMAKALSAEAAADAKDDKTIAAAAEGADPNDRKKNGDADAAEDEAFGKSFAVRLADGTEAEAFDGTEMMKSLHGKVLSLTSANATLSKALESTGNALKAHTAALEAQGGLIKSLQDKVAQISGSGVGRKTTLSVNEKPAPAAPATQEGISPGDFMNKAMNALEANRITGHELSVLETTLNRGMQPDPGLVRKVLA